MTRVETPQGICSFGIARCDVTPPVGIYHRMWGAAKHDRSAGVHRPLTATACVFQPIEDGGNSDSNSDWQILVALDHCLFRNREMDELTRHVCDAAGIDEAELLVVFSHTHAAGLMERDRADLPGGELIGPYLDELADKTAGIVQQAIASVQPATLAYETGHCALAANRDYWDEASDAWVCGVNPAEPADDTLLVIRVSDEQGETLATLVNYACHPTTLAWDNDQISPDYPGAMREVIEEATGAPCVFLLGACGDLGPWMGYVGDTRIADRNGRQLGYAALSLIESLPPPRTCLSYDGPVVSGATLGYWSYAEASGEALTAMHLWRRRCWSVDLPYRTDLMSRQATLAELERWQSAEQTARDGGDESATADARAMVERMNRQLTRIAQIHPGGNFAYRIVLWRVGDGLWVAVEGEPYNLLQQALREHFSGTPIVVMTLAGGSRTSYLPDEAAYEKDIYQQNVAMLEKGALEAVIEAAGAQIAAWLEDDEAARNPPRGQAP